jgi:branched-chain amino acid transport system substrate-binding protein
MTAIVAGLVVAACGAGAGSNQGAAVDVVHRSVTATTETAGDVVRVEAVEPISVALLACISGDYPQLGKDAMRAVDIAIDYREQIQGHPISLALTEDDLCNGPGGQAGAKSIVSHPEIVAVIGPSFSVAAVTAAPIVTETGRVLVSGTTDSPLLTSIAGERAPEWHEGYFTTAESVAFQGTAAAQFAAEELQAESAITVASAGDLFAEATASEFAAAFSQAGGTVTTSLTVDPDKSDIPALLRQAAEPEPDAVFLSTYVETPEMIDEISRMDGFQQASLISWYWPISNRSDGQMFYGSTRKDMYHTMAGDAGSTQAEGHRFIAEYRKRYGEDALTPYAESMYDAAVILFNAVDAVARTDGEGLVIDLVDLRQAMYRTDHQGASGHLVCDEFGDCSDALVDVVEDGNGRGSFVVKNSYRRGD